MSRIITVASAKGGVGKTTLALNLAAALTRLGHDAVAVDADLDTPTLSVRLGIPQPERHLHGHLLGNYALEHAILRHTTSNTNPARPRI